MNVNGIGGDGASIADIRRRHGYSSTDLEIERRREAFRTGDDPLFTGETENTEKTEAVSAAKLDYVAEGVNMLESIGEELGQFPITGDLDVDFDTLEQYPAKLDEMLVKIEKVIKEKTEELEQLNAERTALQADQTAINVRLDKLNKEMAEAEDKMNQTAASIEQRQAENEDAQAEFMAKYNSAVASAEANYNPETDGDKEDYIAAQTSGLGSAVTIDISSLQSEYEGYSDKIGTLTTTINAISQTLTNVENKLKTVETKIVETETALNTAKADKAEVEAEKQTIPAKAKQIIKNAVGEEEWAVVEKNNIDLSEKLDDGSPKYMIAKGDSDGKYHIYDLDAPEALNCTIRSLVRIYEPNMGKDIIEWGNGHMQGSKDTMNFMDPDDKNSAGGKKVYRFTLSDTDFGVDKKVSNYETVSPLAFDLDNNGFKTSNDLIKYDIDGDGVLDNINNVFEGVLAFDKDGDGIVGADGSELFGNNTDIDGDGVGDGYKDGFEALKALAYKENLIDGQDDMELDENDLNLLSQKYGLSMKMGYTGEAKSLKDIGLTSINLASTNETHLQDDFDGQGNQLMTQEGATFIQNGVKKNYADIWNAKK